VHFKLKQKANFEAIVFSGKPLETEILLTEVQFVIDSCCLVNELNYLRDFNKECDWLINEVCFENIVIS